MRSELVAIDLETTGLDPSHDQIIEIGAVRFKDGEIIAEFSQLVDPGRPIPPLVTSLTGLRNEDLIGMPRIAAVLPALRNFVGQSAWVGHNVGFDASFLYAQGVLQNNLRLDTYEMASVLLPSAPRYNLTSLTSLMGFDIESAHRALYDARATAHLYWMLWNKACALPFGTLREIVEASADLRWDARPAFEAALLESAARTESVDSVELFAPDRADRAPLRPNEEPQPLDAGTIGEAFGEDGKLEHNLPGYERRQQQIDMAFAILDAFNQSKHVMVEAGTGTGKSIAYLVPSIYWALRNNERVVISTNTINLQEQLIFKDVPAVRAALGVDVNAAVMKGRANYLCPRRLATVRRRRPTSVDELRTLAKILVWLLESRAGDRGEITLRGPEENITWARLSAEDEGCTLDRCRSVMDGACPFYKARKAAEEAHVLVVNHALLISDALSDNRVLPDYRYLVIDEAHHLEEATTGGLSFRIDAPTLLRRLADLGGVRRGLLGNLLASVKSAVPEKDSRKLESYIATVGDAAATMETHVIRLFDSVRALLADLNIGRSDYTTQIRVTDVIRSKAGFAQVQASWGVLAEFFEAIGEAMHQLAVALTKFETHNIPEYEELVNSTESAGRYLEEVHAHLMRFFTTPDANTVYWISVGQDADNLSLQSAPLHVGAMVEDHLWHAKESIVLTSATLGTRGSFDYIRSRLNADGVNPIEVGSPFNYRESTLLYIPNDMPDPNDRQRYQQAVERGLIELTAALNGRVMALFTSYTQLRQTAQAISPRLALGNIAVFDQSDGTSRQALLDGFKSADKAILLGTRSFWEGIDIPGEMLSALVIARLPFSVPTDPVFAARSETYADSFNDFTLPDAILRFRQGFGRLIRTKTDRGIVAIFDARIHTKSYGSAFLESLPDCTVQYGPLNGLPGASVAWLERGSSA